MSEAVQIQYLPSGQVMLTCQHCGRWSFAIGDEQRKLYEQIREMPHDAGCVVEAGWAEETLAAQGSR